MMQRRLSQIAQIPLIIQTTLDAVARSFDDFLPPEMMTTPAEVPLTLIDLSAFVEASQAKADEPLEVEELGGEYFVDDEKVNESEEIFDEIPSVPTPEPEPEPEIVEAVPEPTEEEILRMEKLDRVIIIYGAKF